MKIAVMGTGGTGGYYGGLLAQRGEDVVFIARGAHLQAIQRDGLQIKSVFGDFLIKPAHATDKPSDVGAVDLLFFCTKTYDTDAAAKLARPLVGPKTTVLSIQNGLDAHERLGRVFGMEHMIAGVASISSALQGPGVINQVSKFRTMTIGEINGKVTPRLQAIEAAFRPTGVDITLAENILVNLWTKLAFISVAAGFGSLTRLPMASFRSVPETRALMSALIREAASVAAAEHVDLGPDIVERTLTTVDNVGPTIKASMQLDVESGRRTELDSIIGVISRKGRLVGVPTDVADMIYGMLLPVDMKAQAQAN